jgi:hypothetical protein
MQLPSKQECFFILEMLEASLIDFSYTQPWADILIAAIETPPFWLCELATKTYRGAQIKAIREHVFSEPFVAGPEDLEKFHVACLWLRYERRELSWATFLRYAGEYLDACSGEWDCETLYHYLNVFGDAYFSEAAEQDTRRRYLADHNLKPWIEKAHEQFAPFKQHRRAIKSLRSRPE